MLEDSCCCATQRHKQIHISLADGDRKDILMVLEIRMGKEELTRSVFACESADDKPNAWKPFSLIQDIHVQAMTRMISVATNIQSYKHA